MGKTHAWIGVCAHVVSTEGIFGGIGRDFKHLNTDSTFGALAGPYLGESINMRLPPTSTPLLLIAIKITGFCQFTAPPSVQRMKGNGGGMQSAAKLRWQKKVWCSQRRGGTVKGGRGRGREGGIEL